jgi:hypothetical protein
MGKREPASPSGLAFPAAVHDREGFGTDSGTEPFAITETAPWHRSRAIFTRRRAASGEPHGGWHRSACHMSLDFTAPLTADRNPREE